jgi:hypothetical protein
MNTSNAEIDLDILTSLLEKRENEIIRLHNLNSKLHEEISSLTQTKELRTEVSKKNAEITSLRGLVTSLQSTARRWEFLAHDHSKQAADNFLISETLREKLGNTENENRRLSEFVRELVTMIHIEHVPKNFRYSALSTSSTFRAVAKRLIGEVRELNVRLADVKGMVGREEFRAEETHQEVVELVEAGKRKVEQLRALATGTEQVGNNKVAWNSSLKWCFCFVLHL